MSNRLFATVSGIVTIVFAAFIFYVFQKVFDPAASSFASVATLILVGLAAFIGIMNFLSFSSHMMGIADPRQPFGLPEGTVRAILTIAFIVLVGVLASFLLTQSSREVFSKETIRLRQGLTATDAQSLVQQYSADGLVLLIPGKDGKVDVEFRARHDYRLADDVSKQILTILSTILAAMIGFYFGARPADSSPPTPDPAERSKLLHELDALVAQGPTAQAIRTAADTKLAAVTDPQKKVQIEGIKTRLGTAEVKFDVARKAVNDASQPIERARTAFADGKAAIQEFRTLNQELGQINTP
jgi:hypothetical protein